MTDARASHALAALALVLALLVVVGCGEDDSTPTFPDQPEPEIGLWFLGVWGSGPNDVYVVGQPGLIFRWNGESWTQEDSGTDVALTDVWGDGAGTVYATGHDGVILRREAGAWTSMDTDTDADFFAIGSFQGTTYACGRTDDLPALQVLSGGSWSTAPGVIYQRDTDFAVIDTLDLASDEDPEEIIESLTAVGHFGVTGADGVILMEDPEVDWQLRRVLGGEAWVTCSTQTERLTGNFIGTDSGDLFGLTEGEGGRLSWSKDDVYSPAVGTAIYGVFAEPRDTVWVCTQDGRINRLDPPHDVEALFHELYDDGKTLFDIWGSSGTDLYAVGIEGRVLHFTEVEGEYQWVAEDLPLPELKHHARPVFDKFGRPLH